MYSIPCYLYSHSAARSHSPESHAGRLQVSLRWLGGWIPWSPLFYTHNEHMLVYKYLNTNACTQEHSHVPLTHKHAQRHRSLVPLLVTCNYVAMMSLIFCIGWKLHDAERLESAGKCLAVWNTNMLICEQRLKEKCFSMQTPPAYVYLHRVETEGKTKWATEWVAGWVSPDGHVGSWPPDRPIDRPRGPEWTERRRRKRK